jgi:hypothetical protein
MAKTSAPHGCSSYALLYLLETLWPGHGFDLITLDASVVEHVQRVQTTVKAVRMAAPDGASLIGYPAKFGANIRRPRHATLRARTPRRLAGGHGTGWRILPAHHGPAVYWRSPDIVL